MNIPFKQYWNLLVNYLRPLAARVGLLALLLLAGIGMRLVNPQIMRSFIDTAVSGGARETLLRAGLLFFGIALVNQLMAVAATYLSESVAWTATNALRLDLFKHCLGLDQSFHKAHTPGELIERIDGDVSSLSNFFSRLVIHVAGNFILLLGVLILLFREDWRVGLSLTGATGYFVFYAAVIWLFFSLGFWLWQPYMNLSAVPIAWFGFVYAVQSLVSGYASKQAHRVENKIGVRRSLLLIPLLLATAFVLESQFVFVLGFLFIFIQSIAGGCFGPLLGDYINKRIPSSKRATVLSIKNMVNSILFITISPLLGHFVDLYSLTTALLLMGVALVVTALAFSFAYGVVSRGEDGGLA